MKLQTITQVTRRFQLSTRTLRYYEQLGLIQSQKKDDYAYRVYSEDMILRLEQILLLKELKIPLKKDPGNFRNGKYLLYAFYS